MLSKLLLVLRYVLEHSGLKPYSPSTNPEGARSNPSSGGSSEDLAKKYFATLEHKQFLALKDLYRNELEAFGYDPDPYELQS